MEGGVGVVPVLHEHCEDVVALLLEKQGCNARIDSSGESDTHFYLAIVHIIILSELHGAVLNIFFIIFVCFANVAKIIQLICYDKQRD